MTPPNFEGVEVLILPDWLPGDSSQISPQIIADACTLCARLGTKAVITSGFRPASAGSQHALGKALDLMFPDYPGTLREIYDMAESVGFQGLGVYPTWKLEGKLLGGIHVDCRDGDKARWMGLGGNSSQKYIALSEENLEANGVV